MGLTIHYSLKLGARRFATARTVIETLYQRARDLPLHEVGPIVDFSGEACDYNTLDRDDPNRWLLIQAGQHVEHGGYHYHVVPNHVIAFTTAPGEGCEPANFGLCQYPAMIMVEHPNPTRRRTHLGRSWRWSPRPLRAGSPCCLRW